MKTRLFIFLVLFFPVTSIAAEKKDAFEIYSEIGRNVQSLFYQNKFDQLNRLEQEYRSNKNRLPDGRWKLTAFYDSLGQVSKRGAFDEWKLNLEIVQKWVDATPNAEAAYLAKAEMLYSFAWSIRGSGFAYTVKKNDWELFKHQIGQARKVLEDSKRITGTNPFWYHLMLRIAKIQSWDKVAFDKLYIKAITAYPTYYQLYFRAADYYEARWSGSKEDLNKFVLDAVSRSKDKEGMTLYARIYWTQIWSLDGDAFSEGNVDWELMKQGFERIMQDFPDSRWNLNAYANFACMARDWNKTKTLMKRIGSSPHLKIWESMSKYYQCKAKAESGKGGRYQVDV